MGVDLSVDLVIRGPITAVRLYIAAAPNPNRLPVVGPRLRAVRARQVLHALQLPEAHRQDSKMSNL